MIKQAALVICLISQSFIATAATTIGTEPPSSLLSGFGSSEVYRVQVFYVPSLEPRFADTLTVYVGPTTDKHAKFRILLTEVTFGDGFHPTNVLWESETLEVPVSPERNPTKFEVDLGGTIRLTADRAYAWILDHFAVGSQDNFVSMGTGLGDYPPGAAYTFPNGPFFPAGNRADHFASMNWKERGDEAFAFQLQLLDEERPFPFWAILAMIAITIALVRKGILPIKLR